MRICGGELRGRQLKTIEGPGYRPAMARVREALFSMLDSRGINWSETRVLDLFAGSGSLSFEALSRGAKEAMCVESNVQAAMVIEQNAKSLGINSRKLKVAKEEVGRFLARRATQSYNLIFVDPPYGYDYLSPSMKSILRQGWLAEGGFLTAELEAKPKKGEGVDLSKLPLELSLEADRTYGQTRVLVWMQTPTLE